jgi:hypothetical protein
MVILSSCGLKVKEKCGDLLKVVQNKSVLCAVIDKNEDDFIKICQNVEGCVKNISKICLNANNITEILNFDCLYIMENNIHKLCKLFNNENVRKTILKFIELGLCVICEGESSLIFLNDLSYIDELCNRIVKSFSENSIKQVMKKLCFVSDDAVAKNNGLGLSNEKLLFHVQHFDKEFLGICKLYEKAYNVNFTYLKDGDFIIV